VARSAERRFHFFACSAARCYRRKRPSPPFELIAFQRHDRRFHRREVGPAPLLDDLRWRSRAPRRVRSVICRNIFRPISTRLGFDSAAVAPRHRQYVPVLSGLVAKPAAFIRLSPHRGSEEDRGARQARLQSSLTAAQLRGKKCFAASLVATRARICRPVPSSATGYLALPRYQALLPRNGDGQYFQCRTASRRQVVSNVFVPQSAWRRTFFCSAVEMLLAFSIESTLGCA